MLLFLHILPGASHLFLYLQLPPLSLEVYSMHFQPNVLLSFISENPIVTLPVCLSY